MASSSFASQLFLLDGMALAYRAFYAFISSPMRSSSGMNTSAVFGFANTLASILDKEKPTHIVGCFDAGRETARSEIYPEYKANRQAMPDELRASIPYIIRILEAMNIPVLCCPGYEADDLIGTLTLMAESRPGMESFMVSQDKDLGQLLSPKCKLWKPGKRNAEHEVIDCARFEEQWGIERPEQIIDILALMGDSSDNIPGVPGIGEKTAKSLIASFGSVENLLAHTDELKGKRRALIEENAEKALLSKKLVIIDRHVPLETTLDDCVRREYDPEKLRAVLLELDLKHLATRLCGKKPASHGELFERAAAEASQPAETSDGQMLLFEESHLKTLDDIRHDYAVAADGESRRQLAAKLAEAASWSFAVATSGPDPLLDKLKGLSFCIEPHEAWYVPVADPGDLDAFRPAFLSRAEKIGHDVKFALEALHTAGIETQGPFFDTMLAHAAVEPDLRHNRDEMAEVLLRYRTLRLDEESKGSAAATMALSTKARYHAEDADITRQLADILKRLLSEQGQEKLMREIEFPLMPVLAAIEEEGMRVDPALLNESSEEMGRQLDALKSSIDARVGRPININSPKQLGELLFGEMKLVDKPKKTKTGQFVTDEETLRKLVPVSPLVADILEYREASKLKGTYLDALPRFISPKDGRIHTTLLQMLTATGRLASQSPNLQNIPIRSEAGRLIRRAFIPRSEEYTMLSADYSQVELRIMAALSGDPHLMEAFREGRDIHTETAARVYHIDRADVSANMRRAAKTVNFGIIYGISAFGLSQRLSCPRAEATQLIENYFAEFSRVKTFMDQLIETAREKGYAETLSGRRRYLPDLKAANHNLRAAAERTAINTPIQGTAADMIKMAMIRVAALLSGRRSRLIMQIHDELLFDLACDERELIPAISEEMRLALPLPNDVPLAVEANTGDNWLAAH